MPNTGTEGESPDLHYLICHARRGDPDSFADDVRCVATEGDAATVRDQRSDKPEQPSGRPIGSRKAGRWRGFGWAPIPIARVQAGGMEALRREDAKVTAPRAGRPALVAYI